MLKKFWALSTYQKVPYLALLVLLIFAYPALTALADQQKTWYTLVYGLSFFVGAALSIAQRKWKLTGVIVAVHVGFYFLIML